MTLHSYPKETRYPLKAVLLASLVAGVVSGATVFALTRIVEPRSTEPREIASAARQSDPVSTALVTAAADDDADEIDLRDALDVAEGERSQLAGTVLALNRRAESLENRLAALIAASDEESEASDQDAPELDATSPDTPAQTSDTTEPSVSDSLVAAGLDPASAADIRRRRDAFQLARLELIDQAAREGWEESDQFSERLRALETRRPDLRSELGDEAYDRYLHEEGSRNRVGIEAVISGSAADQVGLVPGDVILSYAGSRVFRSRELQAATREGQRGESVQVSVLRDGEIMAVDLPRGPLGVTLTGLRRPPG